MAATMPKMVNSDIFLDLFALAITLGGSGGQFLKRLAEYYGQWVNPTVRQVRLSSLALLGGLPAKVGDNTLAPLIVAIIEATYAADLDKYVRHDYIEWLTPKDVKINEQDKTQMDRLRLALAGLHFCLQ